MQDTIYRLCLMVLFMNMNNKNGMDTKLKCHSFYLM